MQGELFEVGGPVVDASKISSKPTGGWKDAFRVTLRLDHLSVVAICALVMYVLVFSFGVEKGKRFAFEELRAEKAKKEMAEKELARALIGQETPLPAPGLGMSALAQVSEKPQKEDGTLEATGRYTIQVITFKSQALAEEKVRQFKEKGYQSFIIPSGKYFQVCIESFESTRKAQEKLVELRAEGFARPDAFIRPLKGQIT